MPVNETPAPGQFSLEPPCPMIWANLVKPQAYQRRENGRPVGQPGLPQFRASFMLPAAHPLLDAMKGVMAAVATEKLKITDERGVLVPVPFSEIRWPIKDGNRLADEAQAAKKNREYLRGHVLLTTKSVDAPDRNPPRLSVLVSGAWLHYETPEERKLAERYLYNGVLAAAKINFSGMTVDGRHYVTAYLNTVYSLNQGDKIAGGHDDEMMERLSGYAGQVSAVSPSAGMSQAIRY